jgi:hypothetical protein
MSHVSFKFKASAIPLFLLHDTSEFQDPSSENVSEQGFKEVLSTFQLPVNGRFVNWTRLICENYKDNIYSKTISEDFAQVYERSPIYGTITVFASSFSTNANIPDSSVSLSSCLGTSSNKTTKYQYQALSKDIVLNAIKRFHDYEDSNHDLSKLLDVYFKTFHEHFPRSNDLLSLRRYVTQHMNGFEHGVEKGWWGAKLLHGLASSPVEGTPQVTELLQAKLIRLYITFYECHFSKIIFHVVDGNCRCMSLDYACSGFVPKGLACECRQEDIDRCFKELTLDRLGTPLDIYYLSHGGTEPEQGKEEDDLKICIEKMRATSIGIQQQSGMSVPHDVVDTFSSQYRHMLSNMITGFDTTTCPHSSCNTGCTCPKGLCHIPFYEVLRDLRVNHKLDQEQYKVALRYVHTPEAEIDHLVNSEDEFCQWDRIQSNWIIYVVLRQYLSAFEQISKEFKNIAAKAGFDIDKLMKAFNSWGDGEVFNDEDILDHLLMRVRGKKSKEPNNWIVSLCPFENCDTLTYMIKTGRTRVRNPLHRFNEKTYHGHCNAVKESKFTDITFKHFWMTSWSFLDYDHKENADGLDQIYDCLLRKQPGKVLFDAFDQGTKTYKGETMYPVPQRTPGGTLSLTYVMNAFYAIIEQFVILRSVIDKCVKKDKDNKDKKNYTWPQLGIIHLALLRRAFIEGVNYCIAMGPDPTIDEPTKEVWSYLGSKLDKMGVRVRYECHCTTTTCCSCVGPFSHECTFRLVIFSFLVKKSFPKLEGVKDSEATSIAHSMLSMLGSKSLKNNRSTKSTNKAIRTILRDNQDSQYYWDLFFIPGSFSIAQVLLNLNLFRGDIGEEDRKIIWKEGVDCLLNEFKGKRLKEGEGAELLEKYVLQAFCQKYILAPLDPITKRIPKRRRINRRSTPAAPAAAPVAAATAAEENESPTTESQSQAEAPVAATAAAAATTTPAAATVAPTNEPQNQANHVELAEAMELLSGGSANTAKKATKKRKSSSSETTENAKNKTKKSNTTPDNNSLNEEEVGVDETETPQEGANNSTETSSTTTPKQSNKRRTGKETLETEKIVVIKSGVPDRKVFKHTRSLFPNLQNLEALCQAVTQSSTITDKTKATWADVLKCVKSLSKNLNSERQKCLNPKCAKLLEKSNPNPHHGYCENHQPKKRDSENIMKGQQGRGGSAIGSPGKQILHLQKLSESRKQSLESDQDSNSDDRDSNKDVQKSRDYDVEYPGKQPFGKQLQSTNNSSSESDSDSDDGKSPYGAGKQYLRTSTTDTNNDAGQFSPEHDVNDTSK